MMAAIPPSQRRVAICADDFGLGDAADRAILELGASNAITATSVAVDGPVVDRDASALRELRGQLSIGLHLNLTDNPYPKGPLDVRGWITASWLRRIDIRVMERELRRQFDRFEQLFGTPPTHVDGHEHVHQFPGLREALLETMASRCAPTTPIRCTWPRHFRGMKAAAIGLLGAKALRHEAGKMNRRCNSDFAGVYDLRTASGFGKRMDEWLRSIHDGGLVMCHPETAGPRSSAARVHEYEFLRSPAWPALRRSWNIRLVRPDAG